MVLIVTLTETQSCARRSPAGSDGTLRPAGPCRLHRTHLFREPRRCGVHVRRKLEYRLQPQRTGRVHRLSGSQNGLQPLTGRNRHLRHRNWIRKLRRSPDRRIRRAGTSLHVRWRPVLGHRFRVSRPQVELLNLPGAGLSTFLGRQVAPVGRKLRTRMTRGRPIVPEGFWPSKRSVGRDHSTRTTPKE
jgi:hypothetical protein